MIHGPTVTRCSRPDRTISRLAAVLPTPPRVETVPRLVVINGAPGSGKSTLARRYAHDHPLTVALDIDHVRAMLGRWLDTPTEAGLLVRQMAVEMARVHLCAGHDVVVPQFLGPAGVRPGADQEDPLHSGRSCLSGGRAVNSTKPTFPGLVRSVSSSSRRIDSFRRCTVGSCRAGCVVTYSPSRVIDMTGRTRSM